MKVGVICRADNRGIGRQTYDFWKNLPADRALVVIAGTDLTNNRPISPYAQRPERFNKGEVLQVTWNPPERFDWGLIHNFLEGLSVVYLVETPYDYHIYEIAKKLRVKTVLHANPEFYPYFDNPGLIRPDAVWLPTSWLADRIPEATVMPFPVDRSHIPYRVRNGSTILHVVGHRTFRDRNGTITLLQAVRHIRRPLNVIIRSQDPIPQGRQPHTVNISARVADVDDYAELYSEGDVMVLPRKFGGLSLPMQEALAAGIPVLMTDCSPQNEFLPESMRLSSRRVSPTRTPFGIVPTFEAYPRALAYRIDELANDPGQVEKLSRQANELAEELSWDRLRERYMQGFARVCQS